MFEFLENLFNGLTPTAGYLLLFVSAFLENVIPPVPGDTVVVLGAYLVSTGYLDFWGVYISTMLGSLVGFMTMFIIGLKLGRGFIYKKNRARYFKEEHIRKVQVWFSRWGYWVIFANRFLSGTRSVISLFAGFFHLKIVTVLVLALLSAMIWNGLLIWGGMMVGDNWHIISGIVKQYNQVLIVLTLLVAGYFIYRRVTRKKSEKEEKNQEGSEI
jgi:membrane protein DedA with SNARE-associated domain